MMLKADIKQTVFGHHKCQNHVKMTLASDIGPTLDISYLKPKLKTNKISNSLDVYILCQNNVVDRCCRGVRI